MGSHIEGIMPPIVTPFDEQEMIEEEAVREEVHNLIEKAEVHGIVVGGSTGEGHTLTLDEFRQLVGITVEAAEGRVPVIAGIIVDSTREAIQRAQAIRDLDVAALQVTPVHYLFRPDDEMMYRHFATLAEAVGRPVMVYNVVPWSYCSPALLARLITEVDGVIGVKQSAGDLKSLADLLLLLEGRGVVMSAVDALLYPSFALGADGAIAAICTAVPGLCVQLWDAVRTGDHGRALDLHARLLRVWNAIAGDNRPANVKFAMSLQGRRGGRPRMPMPPSSPAQRKAIYDALVAAGVQVVEEREAV